MNTPKFAHVNPSFHVELKNRINDYFKKNNITTFGGYKIYTKAIVLIVLFAYCYIQLVFFTPASTIVSLLLSFPLGIITAGIGFNVMHDGAHGSFSKNSKVNTFASNCAEFIGVSQFMWKMKHNVLHHAYTNIDGLDDDIDVKPFMRLASTQKHYKAHKFQHIYFWILYAILHSYWTFFSDFRKYFTKKIGDVPLKKMKPKDHLMFWMFKAFYFTLFIVLPIIFVGFVEWIIGFGVFTLTTGIIISIVFQLAHTVEHTDFPMPNDNGKMDDQWAVHQLKTTSNFATGNKLISWYMGGLNFQVEHHLFPKISHVHYPAINRIVKQACKEYNVKYNEYKRLHQAVISHLLFLKEMGKAPAVS